MLWISHHYETFTDRCRNEDSVTSVTETWNWHLLNFQDFVTWPPSCTSTLNCLLFIWHQTCTKKIFKQANTTRYKTPKSQNYEEILNYEACCYKRISGLPPNKTKNRQSLSPHVSQKCLKKKNKQTNLVCGSNGLAHQTYQRSTGWGRNMM